MSRWPGARPTTTRSWRSTSSSAGSSSAASTRTCASARATPTARAPASSSGAVAGPFALAASVQSDATADAVREALGELRAIRGERPVTAEELELGRAPLTRGYPRGFETAEQIESRHRPDRALRSPRRLLHDVRAQGARAHPRGPDPRRRHPHRSLALPGRHRRRPRQDGSAGRAGVGRADWGGGELQHSSWGSACAAPKASTAEDAEAAER